MAGKIIEVNCGAGHLATLLSGIESSEARLLSSNSTEQDSENVTVRLFVRDRHIQKTLDRLQSTLPAESQALILLIPVDARVGGNQDLVDSDDDQVLATREELFREISRGTELDQNFVLLTLLATLVAAIGIADDNIAVVIGAMVIAPLLGPNLGLALGAALGDKELIRTAIFTNAAGLSLTIIVSGALALLWTPNMESHELLSRTIVQPASVALALASGIAAVQSLTTRLANTLVGVMVAVALVPPATVLGMMIGVQNWQLAGGAALLLGVNIAAVNLAAQLVFVLRGIRPRTWLARREAKEATWINLLVWFILLSMCSYFVARLAA